MNQFPTETIATILSFLPLEDASILARVSTQWRRASASATKTIIQAFQTAWNLEHLSKVAYLGGGTMISQYQYLKDLKSVETNGTIISSSTLEELGSHRNGGPRSQFFYLRTPLWAPNRVPSSLPSYDDIYEVLVDSMGECKPLLYASGPQTAQGAFAELLDVAVNPGVYGRQWKEYNEVAATVDAAFCELIGLPEEDRKQDIKQIIQQASKECVFFTGDARKLPDADRFFSWAQQWIHFVGCIQKDARTVVMFSFDESD